MFCCWKLVGIWLVIRHSWCFGGRLIGPVVCPLEELMIYGNMGCLGFV